MIHTTNQLQYEKLKNIEDIFNAADLTHSGVLDYSELLTLYKMLGPSDQTDAQQKNEARKLFDEYSEMPSK